MLSLVLEGAHDGMSDGGLDRREIVEEGPRVST